MTTALTEQSALNRLLHLLVVARTADQRCELDAAIAATPLDPAQWRTSIPVRLYCRQMADQLTAGVPSIIAEQDKRPAEAVAQLLMNVMAYGIEIGRNWPVDG